MFSFECTTIMELIDTHTHLYLHPFNSDRKEVVERALHKHVSNLLLPNIDSGSVHAMLEMRDNYPGICFPMMGLHPSSVKENFEKELAIAEEWLKTENFIAIGETGIDLYWDSTFKDRQLAAFEIQVKWAGEKQLPLVIHARESFREIFSILNKYGDNDLKGVFHSFTGNAGELDQILEYGFYIGINGIITFKNSPLAKLAEKIPPEKLLLETDSPYLAPVPERGKRNESSFIIHTAKRMAEIYGISVTEIARITTRNAKELFRLIK